MEKKTDVDDYFAFPESNRPMELVYGYVREPAMPTFGHEAICSASLNFSVGMFANTNLEKCAVQTSYWIARRGWSSSPISSSFPPNG